VSAIAGRQPRRMIVALAMMASWSAHGAAPSLAPLVDAVLAQGPRSTLPAHLSVVLGISAAESATAVKQAVVRDGHTVRTFNVRLAGPGDVVLMTVDEQDHATRAYLITVSGVLRKAVSYRAGAPAMQRNLMAVRADYASELKFWLDVEQRQAAAK